MSYYRITEDQKELLRQLVAEYRSAGSVQFIYYRHDSMSYVSFRRNHRVDCKEGDLDELSKGGYVNYSESKAKGTVTQAGIDAADSNFAPTAPPVSALSTQHFHNSQYIQMTGDGNTASIHAGTGSKTSDALYVTPSILEQHEDSRKESTKHKSTYWNDVIIYLNYIFSEHFLGVIIFTIAMACICIPLFTINLRPIWWGYIGTTVLANLIIFVLFKVAADHKSQSEGFSSPPVNTVPSTTKSSGPISASEIIEARKKIVSAIKESARPTAAHGENDILALELYIKSWVSEFQDDVMESLLTIQAAINVGIRGESREFANSRRKNQTEWANLLKEFATDVMCTGPFFMLTMPDGKERATRMLELVDIIYGETKQLELGGRWPAI